MEIGVVFYSFVKGKLMLNTKGQVPPGFHGKKGRSGRRKPLGKQIDEAMKLLDAELPGLIQSLINKANNGDREALIYLIDRRMGKPKQSSDIDLTGGQQLGTGLVVELFKILSEKKRQLKSGEPVLLEGVKREDE